MPVVRSFSLLVIGLVIGVSMVLACGDDSPRPADAAVCECPLAEPPLADRIVRVTATIPIPANAGGAGAAGCPSGALLLGGGCSVDAPVNTLTLSESGPRASGYACAWLSTSVLDAEGRATAICLLPAP